MGSEKAFGGLAMWQTRGVSANIIKPIIARFSREKANWWNIFSAKTIGIYSGLTSGRHFLVSLSDRKVSDYKYPIVSHVPTAALGELNDGDILQIMPDGRILRVYDIYSKQNVLFITEKCNSRCIMCPQPQQPLDHDQEVLKILSLLPKEKVKEICVSGGEPTINSNFINIMKKLTEFPNVDPMVLTNGRRFSNFEFTKAVVANAPYNTQYAIPLYSAVPAIHDSIVGAKGAFKETIMGLHNLTKFRIPVEIRIVLTRQNITGLRDLSEFIGWNLPMVVHVAFMGMEIHGRAEDNKENVWIEPINYMQELTTAVKNISYRNIPVSIYNLPLCLLPKELWRYSKKSISSWKQGYQSECKNCAKKETCGGFFTTSAIIPEGIHRL